MTETGTRLSSSVGQSDRLLSGRSEVRLLSGTPFGRTANSVRLLLTLLPQNKAGGIEQIIKGRREHDAGA